MLLIVSNTIMQAEDLSDMMNFMGILSVAETASQAIFEICANYRAVIVINPYFLEEKIENSLLERAEEANIPIFSIGRCYDYEKYSCNLEQNLHASEILDRVIEKCKALNCDIPGEYKALGIDVSCARQEAIFFSKKISLTKTELMIVRALLRLYPKPAKAEKILKLSFRKKRSPDEGSIRTHISKINKKCMKILGRTLIFNFEKLGYVLSLKDSSYIF